MHIKNLIIKNWLGIKALEFSPGKINKVSGDSGTGKTSLIEALEKVFTNRNRRTEVIRHDEEEAELFVELDDGLRTTRKVRTEKAPYLKVEHESKAVSSTEGYLKRLINGDIFRPIEFVSKTAKEQTEIILNMLQIPWDADDIKKWFGEVPEADYQLHILQILRQIEAGYYSERESINREVNLLRLNVEGIKRDLPPNYDGEEWRGVNLQELYNKLSEAETANKRLSEAKSLVDGLTIRINDIQERAKTAAEFKRLDYQRQRDTYADSIRRLEDKIEAEQIGIDDADRRILDANARLDAELEQAIERLKLQYQAKKQTAKEEILHETEQSRVIIAEYREQLVEKKNSLANIDEHEQKDIVKIADHEANLIALEREKTGNAEQVLAEITWSDPSPLKEAADTAARMKEYLHEWNRMNDIIRDKLAPKEERSSSLTAKIKTARDLPKELLKTAALPVEGLEVDDKGNIRINGTLIDGLSEGESLEFAFRLAKAQSGPLKIICIDGWQNLGSRQKEIIESAKDDDYQYFVLETVDGQDLNIEIMEG